MEATDDLPVVGSLAELTALVERERGLYVRWSRGPAIDLHAVSSIDDLTGVAMPGLSANPLDVEEWWQDRSRPCGWRAGCTTTSTCRARRARTSGPGCSRGVRRGAARTTSRWSPRCARSVGSPTRSSRRRTGSGPPGESLGATAPYHPLTAGRVARDPRVTPLRHARTARRDVRPCPTNGGPRCAA